MNIDANASLEQWIAAGQRFLDFFAREVGICRAQTVLTSIHSDDKEGLDLFYREVLNRWAASRTVFTVYSFVRPDVGRLDVRRTWVPATSPQEAREHVEASGATVFGIYQPAANGTNGRAPRCVVRRDAAVYFLAPGPQIPEDHVIFDAADQIEAIAADFARSRAAR